MPLQTLYNVTNKYNKIMYFPSLVTEEIFLENFGSFWGGGGACVKFMLNNLVNFIKIS